MSMTKVKGKMHYCPQCGKSAKEALRPNRADVKQQEIGRRHGYPYYGVVVNCTKCGWSGSWFIPPDVFAKMEKEHNNYINSGKNHIGVSEFRR